MGRGKKLSDCEVAAIHNLREGNCSISKIAKQLNRSRKVVYNVLRNAKEYGKKKSTGRPKLKADRQRRVTLTSASNFTAIAREIVAEVGVNANVRNVRCIRKERKYVKRQKLITTTNEAT